MSTSAGFPSGGTFPIRSSSERKAGAAGSGSSTRTATTSAPEGSRSTRSTDPPSRRAAAAIRSPVPSLPSGATSRTISRPYGRGRRSREGGAARTRGAGAGAASPGASVAFPARVSGVPAAAGGPAAPGTIRADSELVRKAGAAGRSAADQARGFGSGVPVGREATSAFPLAAGAADAGAVSAGPEAGEGGSSTLRASRVSCRRDLAASCRGGRAGSGSVGSAGAAIDAGAGGAGETEGGVPFWYHQIEATTRTAAAASSGTRNREKTDFSRGDP